LSREFLEGRAGLHELARRHSLSRNLIRLRIREYEAGEFTDEVAEAVRVAEYERKIAKLERNVGQLTMEVDLLKKGARLRVKRSDPAQLATVGPGYFGERPQINRSLPRGASDPRDLLSENTSTRALAAPARGISAAAPETVWPIRVGDAFPTPHSEHSPEGARLTINSLP
jgi:transposase-like protein